MAFIESLKNPKKSHRKIVTLPKRSSRLAEFMGIMLGDGGINNAWQATITMNALKDVEYAHYLVGLVKDLFGIVPAVRKRKTSQALVISIASTTVVDFLVREGLPRGNKLKNGVAVPSWILHNPLYRARCVRGLIDTDGCLFVHTHSVSKKRYFNIGLCFSSASPVLIKQVADAFGKVQIIPHIDKRGRNIYLYREDAVRQYLKRFGTSNERISSVYRYWKRARVAEWARLESGYTRNGIRGSNPLASASVVVKPSV
jgi:intein/homing endonuclease